MHTCRQLSATCRSLTRPKTSMVEIIDASCIVYLLQSQHRRHMCSLLGEDVNAKVWTNSLHDKQKVYIPKTGSDSYICPWGYLSVLWTMPNSDSEPSIQYGRYNPNERPKILTNRSSNVYVQTPKQTQNARNPNIAVSMSKAHVYHSCIKQLCRRQVWRCDKQPQHLSC